MIRTTLAALLLAALPVKAHASQLIVFGAASVTNAVTEIAETFEAETGTDVVTVFDATSRAARQIAEGAPASILISANAEWADWLIACGPGDPATRRTIAGNRLVIAVPADDAPDAPFTFDAENPLLSVPRLALADPTGVPAGVYARQSLEAIGAWDRVADTVLRGDNVRTVLAWLETGAADAGFVYASDAAATPRVAVATHVPDTLHDPVIYEALAVTGADAKAHAFLDYLAAPDAAATFARHGFSAPPATVSAPAATPSCG